MLDGVRFANLYCTTRNRASSETVTSTHPAERAFVTEPLRELGVGI